MTVGRENARVDSVRRVALVIRTAATVGNYGEAISLAAVHLTYLLSSSHAMTMWMTLSVHGIYYCILAADYITDVR